MTLPCFRWARLAGLAGVTAVLAGCYTPGNLGRWPTEADFMTIQPGMSSQEVLATFGPPTWTFGVRQENLTIWNYRYYHGDCVIYQVSIRPDGTVRDAGTGYDPACDSPKSRF
jgi:outer membrane protein assembly factor BamE (lipoprotein component of BamABCDE complex)